MYPYFANKLEHSERFIVRAEWNRNVTEQEDENHLRDVLKAAAALGMAHVKLPQRGGRRERTAKLRLSSATVELKRPKTETTELDAADDAEVENVLNLYRMRWLQAAENLERIAVVLAFVAIRLMAAVCSWIRPSVIPRKPSAPLLPWALFSGASILPTNLGSRSLHEPSGRSLLPTSLRGHRGNRGP